MITLRATREEDLAGLDGLFRDRFGHPFDAAAWRWKYQQVPGESVSRVAVDPAGEVLAHAGALALPARWRGGTGPLWSVVDIAGRTGRHQGMRPPVLDLLGGVLSERPRPGDFPAVTGFPNGRHYRLGRRVFGYSLIERKIPRRGPLPSDSPHEVPVEAAETCPAGVEGIWRACGGRGVVRSEAFLNWRYYARPGRYYRYYRLSAGGGSEAEAGEGLAVFAFVEREAWAAELWLPRPATGARTGAGDPLRSAADHWYDALLAVADDLRRAGLEGWRFWPPRNAIEERVMQRLSLRPLPQEETLVCWQGMRWPEGSRPDADTLGLSFGMGDHDAV